MCAGSCGAIKGAKIAENIKTATSAAPTTANGLCRAMRGSEMARLDTVSATFRNYHISMRITSAF